MQDNSKVHFIPAEPAKREGHENSTMIMIFLVCVSIGLTSAYASTLPSPAFNDNKIMATIIIVTGTVIIPILIYFIARFYQKSHLKDNE